MGDVLVGRDLLGGVLIVRDQWGDLLAGMGRRVDLSIERDRMVSQ